LVGAVDVVLAALLSGAGCVVVACWLLTLLGAVAVVVLAPLLSRAGCLVVGPQIMSAALNEPFAYAIANAVVL
jgi:hypothetical protein